MSMFDITDHTDTTLRMVMELDYEGFTPEQVFDVMGDPARIPDWYVLAKEVRIHDEETFNVVFTFFGDVYEEILYLDAPTRYVYLARGPELPIQDYIGHIEILPSGPDTGLLRWSIHYDTIEGEEFQRILPVMLPAVNRASFEKLATLVGGSNVRMKEIA